MIGFRDMTFCNSPCANDTCRRKLTDEVFEAARKWWGKPEAPIAMADFANLCPDHMVGFPEELEMEDTSND